MTSISAPTRIRCPKCQAEMISFERSGVTIDQCRECRGMFLDRGELERLVDAESGGRGWTGPRMSAPAPIRVMGSPDQRAAYRSEWRTDDDDRDDGHRLGDRDGQAKRRHVLGGLVDGPRP